MKKSYIITSIIVVISFIILLSVDVRASIQAGFPVLSRSGNTTGYANFTGSLTGTSSPCLDGSGNLTITGCSSSAGGGLVTYAAFAVVLSGGTTPIFIPLGGGGVGSTTEANVQSAVQPIATFSNACVNVSAGPGGSDSIVITLRKGAANQAITMTLTGAATKACDSTHTFTNAAADLMDWSIVPSTTIAAYTPNVTITVGIGTLTSGNVTTSTAFNLAQYATNGTTVSGVAVGDCPDTGGNHLNRASATGVWSCGTSGSGGTKAPCYCNPLGNGDRSGGITVTGTVSNNNLIFTALIMGTPSLTGFFVSEAISGKIIKFDFLTNRQITEATFRQQNATAQGTWQWAGSTDDITYTDIGANFTIAAATDQLLTELSTNVVQYRYYRMTGVSGNTSSSPFIFGMLFKIDF